MKKSPQAEEPLKQNHFLYFSKWQNMVDERNADRSPRSFARVVARRRRQLLIVVLFLLTVLLLLLVGTSALETFFGRSSLPLETRGDEARAEKGDFSAYLPSRLYKPFFEGILMKSRTFRSLAYVPLIGFCDFDENDKLEEMIAG